MTSDPRPPLRQTQRSLPIALLRARETVMAPIREMLAASGVNEQKWRILRVLDERGPLELTLLGHEAVLLLPSLTRMIRAMAEEGLVVRTTPDADRRKAVVTITAAGQGVIMGHAVASRAVFARLAAAYGPEKLEMLLDLLDDLQQTEIGKQGRPLDCLLPIHPSTIATPKDAHENQIHPRHTRADPA
jgi:homoprotocatechuate degradation regulator HpaR